MIVSIKEAEANGGTSESQQEEREERQGERKRFFFRQVLEHEGKYNNVRSWATGKWRPLPLVVG